jgi:undecaprenyl-diphosphatase
MWQTVTFVQAMLLAVLQGVSELFPVSSLGHTVLIPALLRWNVNRQDPTFLAFVVVLHLGTALALILFYRREWIAIIAALFRSIARGRIEDDRDERIAWLLIVGTVPVGLLGLLFQDPIRNLFGSTRLVAIFLIANGFIMFLGEFLRKRQHEDRAKQYKQLQQLSWLQSVLVGTAQALALFPGISRSGSSIVAGLLADLDHQDAAKYSFLLATPVIFAAAVLEIPKLWAPEAHVVAMQAILGCVVAGIAAYASVAFLTRYFQHNDLRPFGWYCLAFGALCLVLVTRGVIS